MSREAGRVTGVGTCRTAAVSVSGVPSCGQKRTPGGSIALQVGHWIIAVTNRSPRHSDKPTANPQREQGPEEPLLALRACSGLAVGLLLRHAPELVEQPGLHDLDCERFLVRGSELHQGIVSQPRVKQ